MLRSSTEMTCCCPFCFMGTIEPSKVALFTVIWDMFLLFSWFIYNMTMIDTVTIAPLIINFGYILFMFIVLWDLRDPNGNFSIIKYYNYFRIAAAGVMSIFALSMFILLFVFLANDSLEKEYLNSNWALGFFLFFTPASIIEWGTVIGTHKALKLMSSVPMNELTQVSRYNTSGRSAAPYGIMMATTRTQFKGV